MIGKHNALNAAAASVLALEEGVKIELIDCAGKTDSHEHKSAVILKDRFERYFRRDEYSHIEGRILIFSNVFIYGQAVKDIDIVCAGEFDKGLRLSQVYTTAKKLKGKNQPRFLAK